MLEHLLHNAAAMRRREHEKVSQRSFQVKQTEMAGVMALRHPSIRTLSGSTDATILKVAEQVYQRKYVLPSSVLPYL